MSYCPSNPEEIDQHFEITLEILWKLAQTPPGFQQGSCIPQTAHDTLFSGNQMLTADGYQAFDELRKKYGYDQKNHYGQTPSCSPMSIQGGEQSHSRYEISAYRCDQDFWVHQQMTSPVGSQPLWDGHPQTPGLDIIQDWGTSPRRSEEYNLFQCLDTTPSWEDNSLGQVKTTSVDENVFSGQKPSPTVGGSHSVQVTSFGNQTLHVDGSTHPASSFGAQGQARGSFSDFPSAQGQLPQEKSHLDTQSPGTQKNSATGRFFCTYQGCGKSYTKSFHLKDHMKKHTGEKAYVCSDPGYQWKFYRSGDLQRHKRKHGGQRLHPCARCDKNFSRLNYLKQHQRVCPGALSNPGT
ncbi:LOW QUALITY PROTEIN: Kruppel-like factor 18 [Arvicola amphibius]|uniref:LOW QUALITY PROTEIN: Kruppel-like factor 18 n=1 Tax=Arvicola amphibius TaxID=1047088 RepID=UPI0018E388E8|nr:LOW QUALITY PROTEIN: Kruppel-like factor 18 [Arvicola amphibius]